PASTPAAPLGPSVRAASTSRCERSMTGNSFGRDSPGCVRVCSNDASFTSSTTARSAPFVTCLPVLSPGGAFASSRPASLEAGAAGAAGAAGFSGGAGGPRVTSTPQPPGKSLAIHPPPEISNPLGSVKFSGLLSTYAYGFQLCANAGLDTSGSVDR